MHCDSRRTVCITKEPPGSVHIGRHGDVLQLREHLGQDKEGDVLVGPVGGVGGDGRHVRVSRLADAVVHPVCQTFSIRQLQGQALLPLEHLPVVHRRCHPRLTSSRTDSRGSESTQPAGQTVRLVASPLPSRCHRAHLSDVNVDCPIGNVDRQLLGVSRCNWRVSPHQWLQRQLPVWHLVLLSPGVNMVWLNLRVDLHKDRLYSVGNRVAGVVDIVEELDEIPRQNVVVVIRVRWVSPTKTQEHWQRGAKAEEIFYPELDEIDNSFIARDRSRQK